MEVSLQAVFCLTLEGLISISGLDTPEAANIELDNS